jgi:outer membrane protein assembly factor BamB
MSSGVRVAVAAMVCVLAGCGGEAAKEASLPDGPLGHIELESSGGSAKKNWSMSQYEATGSGFNDKENKLKRNNVGDLEVKWVFDDEDASEPVTSVNANPVVAGGTTFVGTVTGRFFAIDEDGHELWKFTAGPASPSIAPFLGPTSPIFAGALLPEHEDTVIVGDSDGRLSKLDRATGAALWTTDLDDNDLGGFGPSRSRAPRSTAASRWPMASSTFSRRSRTPPAACRPGRSTPFTARPERC